MNTASFQHLTPRAQSSMKWAFVVALLVHALLFTFLWIGIRWQNNEPITVEAEVWDLTTREAAPLPIKVEPLPAVLPKVLEEKAAVKDSDAEIALEREKKRKIEEYKKQTELDRQKQEQLEKEKLEKQKIEKDKQQKEAEKKKQAEEKALQDKLFKENMQRLNGQVGKVGSGGTGDAIKSTGNNRGDPSYSAKIAAKIRSNTAYVVTDTSDSNPSVEFAINLFPDGTLRGPVRKIKSSGVLAFDDAVASAIEKSIPFPRDKTGQVPPSINLVHHMKE